ncbi:hypothetical protein KJ912_00805, partial [Patescibacteria group bacterium]|nr:hypothetical protein [Patescibacteria group bacterium]
ITFKDKLTTRDIFKNFNPPAGPKNRATISKKLAMTLKTAFKKTSRPKNLPGLISPFLLNHLELCPKINQTRLRLVKQRLKSTGALNALMSGAGSTIYGIYPNNYTLKQASNILKKHYSIIILPQ